MAKIVKVEVGLESSVKIKKYVYVKPRIILTAIVEDGEKYEDVYDAVNAVMREKLDAEEKRCYKHYKPLHPED